MVLGGGVIVLTLQLHQADIYRYCPYIYCVFVVFLPP
jgi:hypothetical protein